jgi:type III pantothenate kinase
VILCIDIGNTATKVAVMSGDDVAAGGSVATAALGDGTSLEVLCRSLVGLAPGALDAVAVASVVPERLEPVEAWTAAEWGAPVTVVGVASPLPVVVDVEGSQRVGVDRICAACGAVDARRRDAVVVDVGSAVTVDLVLDLRFLGGAIMPGPRMMLAALAEHTAQLPLVDLDAIDTLFPEVTHPTERAIAFGVGAALAGGILEAVRRLGGDGGSVPVWVTGGLADHIAPALPQHWHLDPHLTVRGLSRIARHGAGRHT